MLHPGAAVPARRLARRHCRRAVELLHAAGYRVVVTGGPDERPLDRGGGRPGRASTSAGGRRSPQLAGVLAGAAAVVVGNTGPAHLAAAVGTPVVSLFAPVVPAARWGPYGVPHVLLGRPAAPDAGTPGPADCPVPGHPCLSGVDPHRVLVRRAAPHSTDAAVPAMNILLWHVHGSWTTAFVQGRHRYLLPDPARARALGRRPAGGLGLAGHGGGDLPRAAGRRAGRRPGAATARRSSSWRPAGCAAAPAGTCRRCTWSTTRPHGPASPAAGTRSPTATTSPWCTSPTSTPDLGHWRHPHRGRSSTASSTRATSTPASSGAAAVVVNEPVRRGRVTGTDLLPGFAAGGAAGRVRHAAPRVWRGRLGRTCAAAARPAPGPDCTPSWPASGLSAPDALDLARAVPDRGHAAGHAGGRARDHRGGRGRAAGRGVRATDPARLARALRELAGRPGRGPPPVRRARQRALDRYGLDRSSTEWDQVLAGARS